MCVYRSALAIVNDFDELLPETNAALVGVCDLGATSPLHENPTMLTFSLHLHACVGAAGKKVTVASLLSCWMLIAQNVSRALNCLQTII
jgi:hypothetical protein